MEATKQAPVNLRQKLKFLGPGVVLAALAIGSGELVLTPRSGAQYGFALLWVINTIAAMNAVVFGLLGFVLLYLDRKLPAYARGHWFLQCIIFIGSGIFLGVAFLKLL